MTGDRIKTGDGENGRPAQTWLRESCHAEGPIWPGTWRYIHALGSLAIAGLAIATIGWLLSPLLIFLGTLVASWYVLAFLAYVVAATCKKISGRRRP